MGDAVLADPQGQKRLPIDSVRPMSMDDGLKLIDAWMAERNKRKYEEVEWDVPPRQVKFPRPEKRNEDLVSENAFLADGQGQTTLATDFWHNGAHNIAPHHEITPGRSVSQPEQELACRAAVAEPGSQTPGVAVNGVALRLPHIKLPLDNQSATASGQSPQKILNEVSAGTNLMAACARRRTVSVMEYKR
jgi:hypothetical protein